MDEQKDNVDVYQRTLYLAEKIDKVEFKYRLRAGGFKEYVDSKGKIKLIIRNLAPRVIDSTSEFE
jgi:hypothetical protein